MTSKIIEKSISIAGRPLVLQVGKVAEQADGAVLARYGDTMVLATVVSAEPGEKIDYFPLKVDYEERLYAGGKIKGSRFVKREGRPSDEAVLTARVIDRSIRPLFPKDFSDEVQVIITVLSVDPNCDPVFLSLIATSAALSISPIPWNGPMAALRVGMSNGNYIINPVESEMSFSQLDLIVSATADDVIMIEAQAEEVEEEKVVGAIDHGFQQAQSLIQFVSELSKEVGTTKVVYEAEEINPDIKANLLSYIHENFPNGAFDPDHQTRVDASEEFLDILYDEFEGKLTKAEMKEFYLQELRRKMRELLVKEKVRIDGRGLRDIRPIEIEVGLLPRTHGSALFKRGSTQVLTITTLASKSLEQLIETVTGEETKRYIHHYNFAPYSTGETGRLGYPRRREIGHGALAEKALLPVIPGDSNFPYTIRLVSEIVSSAGSTSQASICGSSLSLMDAGVPIKSDVAGVAMGLIIEGDDVLILSDIEGLEDALGDMDFKVAGTEAGITVLQLDVKSMGVTTEVLTDALSQAREGRIHILNQMRQIIDEPRRALSKYAPHIVSLKIDPSDIGKIIGSGGATVRRIQEETDTTIDINDDGLVTVAGEEKDKVEKAQKWITGICQDVEAGQIYEGVVKQIVDFGAFVEILPGKEGLLHISEIDEAYVKNVEDFLQEGDKIKVKVIAVDEKDRINLSKKQLDEDD